MTLRRMRSVTQGEAPATGAVAAAVAVLAALLALALVAAGCDMPSTGGLGQVSGSGTPVTKTYDFTGFTRVTADGGFTVTVTRGAQYAVSVTVDDNLVEEHLKVELDGETLRIGLEPLWAYRDLTLEARVTMPGLTGLEASGASTVSATGFTSGDPLALTVSGASALTLAGAGAGRVTLEVSGAGRLEGELEAQELAGEISGAGAVELRGSARRLELDASGGSRFELLSLPAVDAELRLSGGSRGAVTVTGTLSADVSGGSRLEYAGSPQLEGVDSSGGSVVEPAGE
ncbi:MAG TPA: head GIN domain-containing protein [Thermoleophilia bacterium]|nr:head GIN domain-containing protein [Thermoleophilia bacterium]